MKHGLLSLLAAFAVLRCSPEALLRFTAAEMGASLRADVAVPILRYERHTSLVDFQDAMQAQWGSRPEVFTNAYSVPRNEIFLIDEADYYRRLDRLIDDSLVHEYAHFIQVRYKGQDLQRDPEHGEPEAIHVQNAAREKLKASPGGACPF